MGVQGCTGHDDWGKPLLFSKPVAYISCQQGMGLPLEPCHAWSRPYCGWTISCTNWKPRLKSFFVGNYLHSNQTTGGFGGERFPEFTIHSTTHLTFRPSARGFTWLHADPGPSQRPKATSPGAELRGHGLRRHTAGHGHQRRGPARRAKPAQLGNVNLRMGVCVCLCALGLFV